MNNQRMGYRFFKYKRKLDLDWHPNPQTGSAAAFLWGPRQTGKTTYLRDSFPGARWFDLLDGDLRAELSVRPALFRERLLATLPEIVVVDEIQEVPELLSEIHALLERTPIRFVLCGSSARKLRRKSGNLLGGRAIEYHLFPLTTQEVPDLELDRALNHGLLPAHYQSDDPRPHLRAYVNAYLRQEIIEESATRNIPAFTRFLTVAGLTHGQQLNYANMARETGVAAATVRSYYQILEETLLGFTLEPWRKTRKRRLVETAKFYLFDVGVANYLNPEADQVTEGSERYGRSFEHFILNEVRAALAYRGLDTPVSFWRTSSGFEVDLIVGDMQLAVECKSSRQIRNDDLRGLRALREEAAVGRAIVVSREQEPRITHDGIEILPWQVFCARLPELL